MKKEKKEAEKKRRREEDILGEGFPASGTEEKKCE
jgi:hypothetical protein